MRTAAAALLLAFAATAAGMPPRDIGKEADPTQLTHQRDIMRLLTHVSQPLLWEDLATIAKEYKIQPQNYQVPSVAEEYLHLELSGELLPMELPVSILDEYHVEQIKLFFDLLYYAKDFDIFYKTGIYLRNRVNKGLFLPAFYMAAMMRPDMQHVILPPLYDVYPQIFFPSDAIQQTYDRKMQEPVNHPQNHIYIWANYTGYPTAHTPEQKLSYFTEDVGLNDFFAQFFYRYPYFLSAANYTMVNGEVRGDVFFHIMRQNFGRYILERLANGLPEVDLIDYESPVKTSFSPQIRLQNGVEMAPRPAEVNPRDVDVLAVQRIFAAEYRLYEAVDMTHVVSAKEGRIKYKDVEANNILGNLIQSTADSVHPRYYGALFRELLSLFARTCDVTHKYGVASSALGNYETMARDPLFFKIVRRILTVFQQYWNHLPPYTRKDMRFPGLRIESVDVDQLVTYFENFDFDVDNIFQETTSEEAERTTFMIRQERLNHKPYTYRIKVSSEKPVKAIFRIFLGPRLDAYGNEMPLDVARQYFVEYDRFVQEVASGEMEIKRTSRDSPIFRHDALSASALLDLVRMAQKGERPFKPAGIMRYGFPERLALPRGTPAGMPLRLYVIASPLEGDVPAAKAADGEHMREWFTSMADGRTVGFPFDRRIPHYSKFRVPNAYMKDVVVYHKTIDEINRPAA